MKEESEDKRLADYLLGNLPETEQVRLEEEYLADSSAQNRLLIVEDELVDAYLQGQLAPIERDRFEAGFLASSRGRRKLELAKSLLALAAETRRDEFPSAHVRNPLRFAASIRWAFATAVLALIVALAWSNWTKIWQHFGSPDTASQNSRGTQDQGNKQTPPNSAIPDKLPTPEENPSVVPPLSSVASVLLSPASRGVGQSPQVRISRNILQVQIRLELAANHHAGYRVDLLNAKDDKKWSAHGLKPQITASTKMIVLQLPELPATLFDSGEYTLVVSPDEDSASPIAEYPFLVHKDHKE